MNNLITFPRVQENGRSLKVGSLSLPEQNPLPILIAAPDRLGVMEQAARAILRKFPDITRRSMRNMLANRLTIPVD